MCIRDSCLAFIFCIFYCFCFFYSLFMEKGKRVGYICTCIGRNRGHFLFFGFDYRSNLGQTYLGDLVGLGCASDLNFDFVVDICGLSDVACSNRSRFHASEICSSSGYCRFFEYPIHPFFSFMVENFSSSA